MARPRAGTRSPGAGKARSGVRSPRIDTIRLEDLTDSDGSALRRGDGCEARRFTGIDLGGRDLTGSTFAECEFLGVDLHDAALRGVTVSESLITDLHAPVFSAPRSTWRDVRLNPALRGCRAPLSTTRSSRYSLPCLPRTSAFASSRRTWQTRAPGAPGLSGAATRRRAG